MVMQKKKTVTQIIIEVIECLCDRISLDRTNEHTHMNILTEIPNSIFFLYLAAQAVSGIK